MRNAVPVFTDPVYPYDIALVLNGTRTQECRPCSDANFRPIGDIDRNIIWLILCVPAEHWKPQIIAYLQKDVPSPPLHDGATDARCISRGLSGEREEVALVVMGYGSNRGDKKAAVNGCFISFDAAG